MLFLKIQSSCRVVSSCLEVSSSKLNLFYNFGRLTGPHIKIVYNLESSPAPTQHTLQAFTNNHPRFRLYAIPNRIYKLEILNYWAFLKNWLVRHDARNPPSWRTIQKQGLSKDSVITHNLASRRSPSVRHDANGCVTTDSAKLFCLEFQRQIQLLSSWRTNSASRRTVIMRHDAPLSVTTDSAKPFCFQFQRVFVQLSSWRTK